MRTKKINVEFEEVKVVDIDIDLLNLDNYKDKFLSLKNHQRHTDEILEVRGFDRSNEVRVVILIDEEEDEASELKQCKDFVEQFGKVTSCEVKAAWILNDSYYDGLSSELDKDWYVYAKR